MINYVYGYVMGTEIWDSFRIEVRHGYADNNMTTRK